MGSFDNIMQYAIYAAMVLCSLGLVAGIALFIVLERRWQDDATRDAEDFSFQLRPVRHEDTLSTHPWEELRNRIAEMQIVAEEPDRPSPYKHVA